MVFGFKKKNREEEDAMLRAKYGEAGMQQIRSAEQQAASLQEHQRLAHEQSKLEKKINDIKTGDSGTKRFVSGVGKFAASVGRGAVRTVKATGKFVTTPVQVNDATKEFAKDNLASKAAQTVAKGMRDFAAYKQTGKGYVGNGAPQRPKSLFSGAGQSQAGASGGGVPNVAAGQTSLHARELQPGEYRKVYTDARGKITRTKIVMRSNSRGPQGPQGQSGQQQQYAVPQEPPRPPNAFDLSGIAGSFGRALPINNRDRPQSQNPWGFGNVGSGQVDHSQFGLSSLFGNKQFKRGKGKR